MTTRMIAIFVLALAVSSTTQSQLLRGYGFYLGGVAANQTWHYSFIPELTTDNRLGLTAGGFLEFLDFPYLSVVLEAQYSQKGMSYTVPITSDAMPGGTGQFITQSPRVDYLSIPLLAKVRVPTSAGLPYIIGGPRLSLLLARQGNGFELVIDKFESVEFGATVGLGFEVSTAVPVSIFGEFRYNPSFTNAFDNGLLTVKNRSLDLLVGVRL